MRTLVFFNGKASSEQVALNRKETAKERIKAAYRVTRTPLAVAEKIKLRWEIRLNSISRMLHH